MMTAIIELYVCAYVYINHVGRHECSRKERVYRSSVAVIFDSGAAIGTRTLTHPRKSFCRKQHGVNFSAAMWCTRLEIDEHTYMQWMSILLLFYIAWVHTTTQTLLAASAADNLSKIISLHI